jgi:hypothetical protein
MKAAGYIFLALLLAILLYLSVERFTVTITGVDSATPPVVTKMDSPIPTSAMSTTAGAAAPVGISNSAVSLAPPLSAALQPPIPPTPPTPPAQSRLAELEQEEQAAEAAAAVAAAALASSRAIGDGALQENEARQIAASENLLRIRNELAALRR